VRIEHGVIELDTGDGIRVHDLTPQVRERVAHSGIRNGFVTVAARHTTVALTINENEPRLFEDLSRFLARLVPVADAYLHNDIHLRDCPDDEPRNAHSHIMAMLLGSSETVQVSDGVLALGTYQALLLVELDGPRRRSVNVMVVGA
jgi:secondary thiamine-phosphate synthase enzyme